MKKFILTLLTIFFAYYCAYITSGASKKQSLFSFGNSKEVYKLKCFITGETDTTDIKQLYFRGENRYNNQQYDAALRDIKKVLSLDSTNLQAGILMAKIFMANKDTLSAINCLSEQIKKSSDPTEGLMELGNIFKNKSMPDSGFYYYKKAFDVSNKYSPASFEIANYYFQTDKYAQALDYINKAIESEEYNLEYRNLRRKLYIETNNAELAKQDYEFIRDQNPDFFGNYKEKAEKLKNEGNYQSSIVYYKLAIKELGTSRELLEAKAWVYQSLLQYDSARMDFETICQLYPDYHSYFNLAYTFDLLDNVKESIKNYTKSIELNKDNFTAYNNRGYEYYRLKKLKESESDYTKSIELKDDYFLSHYNRGLLYFETKKYDKAVNDYKEALKYAEKPKDIKYSLALAYEKLNKKEEALNAYNDFVKLAENADSLEVNYANGRIAALNK